MRMLVAVSLLMTSAVATAQDGSERRRARDFENDLVREIERGPYVKTNVGTTLYFNTHGQTRPTGASLFAGVVNVALGLGYDFIDRERFSTAVEFQLNQGLFNGPRTGELATQTYSQGDIHTISGQATIEASTYITRRLGIGVRGGGGVTLVPLLVDANIYVNEMQRDIGRQTARGPGVATLHADGALVTLVAGPTFEYYTKLAHFSIGADVDLVYTLGFDLGVNPSGYLKYTF